MSLSAYTNTLAYQEEYVREPLSYTREGRQATVLGKLQDILPAARTAATIGRKLTVPTIGNRPSIMAGKKEELRRTPAELLITVDADGRYQLILSAIDDIGFGRPLSAQSQFGNSELGTKTYNALKVVIDPGDPEACTIYGIESGEAEELSGLSTYASRWLTPDAERFAEACIYGYTESVRKEHEQALAETAMATTASISYN